MKPDAARDARHGAQGRGAQSGRATSRTDGAKPTGGNTARIGANVDGEGRTVAVLPDERTGEAHHGRHVWPEIGTARHFGSTSGAGDRNAAARLRTFTGCKARTFALDEAATGSTAQEARHGAQGRGAQSGRATSRTERGRATGGTETRTGANVDGEGRTVAATTGNGTGKRTTGGMFGRNRDGGEIGRGGEVAHLRR